MLSSSIYSSPFLLSPITNGFHVFGDIAMYNYDKASWEDDNVRERILRYNDSSRGHDWSTTPSSLHPCSISEETTIIMKYISVRGSVPHLIACYIIWSFGPSCACRQSCNGSWCSGLWGSSYSAHRQSALLCARPAQRLAAHSNRIPFDANVCPSGRGTWRWWSVYESDRRHGTQRVVDCID